MLHASFVSELRWIANGKNLLSSLIRQSHISSCLSTFQDIPKIRKIFMLTRYQAPQRRRLFFGGQFQIEGTGWIERGGRRWENCLFSTR